MVVLFICLISALASVFTVPTPASHCLGLALDESDCEGDGGGGS